ncbi:unnamed protein product [Polarella glacialis]|uniref:Uncharacterized protein n=1 Tax=Polarella glacialis TaxID=89957 RepID=A0A813GUV3_POLGL|nr:unnamed protein product [Polarella glacialis]
MLELLYSSAAKACLENYWRDESFREFYLGGKAKWKKLPNESELLAMTVAGMNYPPSQYQLHLQFIHGPLLPFQYALFLEGGHFHYKRFFPYSFLLASLKALEDDNRDFRHCHPDYDIDFIIDEMEKFYGISYDTHWHAMISQTKQMQETYAPWVEKDLEYRIVGNQAFDAQTGFHHPEITVKSLQTSDVKRIQSYGRPYDTDEKPLGGYYNFPAENPKELQDWTE